jgi:hypothetical protein
MIENSYKRQHPDILFNTYCNNCQLGKNNKKGTAIGGAGPLSLAEVQLIVISDYVNFNDKFKGTPFTDNQKVNKTEEKNQWLNGAALLRASIQNLYGLDSYNQCWMTYAIKCEPGNNTIKDEYLRICKDHLQTELHYLNQFAPTAPILVLGGKAFAAMKILLPNVIDKKDNLQSLRRRIDLKYLNHPLCFSVNPNVISKCQFRLEKEVYEYNEDIFVSNYVNYPVLVGSPYWVWKEDLKVLQPYFIK